MINLEKYSFKIYLTLFSLLYLFVLYISGYSYINGILLYCGMIFHNILLVYRAYKKKNIILLIVLLYMFLYTYVLGDFFIYGKQLSVYLAFNTEYYIYKTACIHFLFLIILQGVVVIRNIERVSSIKFRNNKFIFYLSYITAIFLIFTGKIGEFITQGGYGSNEVIVNSRMEYFIIPFFLAFVFSNNNKLRINLLYILGAFYIIRNIMFGGRIEFIIVVLCIIAFKFVVRLKIKQLLVYGLIFIYILNIIGGIRANPYILGTNKWYSIFELSISQDKNKTDIVITNESEVFYSSTRIIGMLDNGIITDEDRDKSFLYFLVSIFVPSSILPEIANLASYKTYIYPVGGGGLISGYFYVYFSFIGVIFIAFFIAKILSLIGNKRFLLGDDFLSIYMLFVFITIPRWFAYSPITLFKLSLYGAIIVYLAIFVDKNLKNRKKI